MQHFLDALSFIGYNGVALKSDLENDPNITTKPHHLELEMAGGLIYEFEIYNIENTYWLGINLKSAHVAHKKTATFVADNRKYFTDWLFLMNPQQGKILYEMHAF
jgi:hypothetical protein